MLRAPSIDSPIKRSLDEIIRDIVQKIDDDRVDETEVRSVIDLDNWFSDPTEPSQGYRSDNMEYARQLQRWAAEGQRLMRTAPAGLNFCVLCRNDADDVGQAVEDQAALRRVLPSLQKRCKTIIDKRYGVHRGYGARQHGAAKLAAELCQKAGKPLAATSSTSAFREVASLVYEALTGQHGANSERACKSLARLEARQRSGRKT